MATHTQSVLINWFGVLFVIVNTFGLGLRLEVGKILDRPLLIGNWPHGRW